ncbi:MAG: glycosyltransferase family 39 protein [Planctomycetota bacterium]|nr:glycosyltransferase family 39 protein [Planctomycetota bacterium]
MSRRDAPYLLLALCCFVLCVVGAHRGLAPTWNPDELGPRAYGMLHARTFVPVHYYYGGLHYYLLMAAELPVFFAAKALGTDPFYAALLTARIVAAILAAGTVLVVGVGLRGVLSEQARLVASFLLAFCYGVVTMGHWSSADIPAYFWATVAMVAAIRYAYAPSRRRLVLAAVLTGFAASTKYNAGLVLLPLLMAYFTSLRERGIAPAIERGRKAAWGLVVFGAFLLAFGAAIKATALGADVRAWLTYAGDDPERVALMEAAVARLALALGVLFSGLGLWCLCRRRAAAAWGAAVGDRDFRLLLLGAAGAFLVTSFTILFRPGAFLHDFFWVYTTSSHYKTASAEGTSFLANAHNLANAMSLPAALLGLLGLPLLARRSAGPARLLLVLTIPYFLTISMWSRHALRWTLLCLPTLAVGAGLLLEYAHRHLPRAKGALTGLWALLALFVVARTALVPIEFFRDPRSAAAADFCNDLPAGTRIAAFGPRYLLPRLPEQVTLEHFNLSVYPGEPGEIAAVIERFRAARPDYAILTQFSERFERTDAFPVRSAFFRELGGGGAGYVLVADIHVRPLVERLPFSGDAPEYTLDRIRIYRRAP